MDIVTIATNFSSSFQYHSRHLILDDIDKPSKYLNCGSPPPFDGKFLTNASLCPGPEGVGVCAFQAQGKEMSPNTFYNPSDRFAPA